MGEGDEEEDYGALIYRESQLRKKEAAAAAAAAAKSNKKKKDSSAASASTGRATTTSTRATSAAVTNKDVNITKGENESDKKRALPIEYQELAQKRAPHPWRRYKYCSADGCTNIAQRGGVCIKHGATWTKKRCSREGCTNFAVKGGVCRRHGPKVKSNQSLRGGVCRRHVI